MAEWYKAGHSLEEVAWNLGINPKTVKRHLEAMGGGGGALAPLAPHIEAAVPATLTVHTFTLPWSTHSVWARAVFQTPVAATPTTSFWLVQAIVSAKG